MTGSTRFRPWQQLKEIISKGDAVAADRYLEALDAGETARQLSRLDTDQQSELFGLLPPPEAAELVDELPEEQAARLIELLPTAQAAAIVDQLPSDEQADLLGRLTREEIEAILGEMTGETARIRRLAEFPPDTAGGLMITEFLAFHQQSTVNDVLADLRAHAEQYVELDVQYAYVTDEQMKLVGVLRLRDLLLSPGSTVVRDIMIADPLHVDVFAPLNELERHFDRHAFFGLPVTSPEGRVEGVVRRADVEAAAEDRASRTLLKFAGILGGEELRTMPLRTRCIRRLSWLTPNVVLNIIAASVIAMYEETLASMITLAIFLPILSDMSGCSGNQAVAVSMRELVLGLVRPFEFLHVLWKETQVGIVNGIVLGGLLAAIATVWQGNMILGVVVGVALAANTVLATCLGGAIPLALCGLKQDPALASGPILTTVTDMCGFFIVLSLAEAARTWILTT